MAPNKTFMRDKKNYQNLLKIVNKQLKLSGETIPMQLHYKDLDYMGSLKLDDPQLHRIGLKLWFDRLNDDISGWSTETQDKSLKWMEFKRDIDSAYKKLLTSLEKMKHN